MVQSSKLVGLEVIERGIARDGYGVFDSEGKQIGYVTSGSPAPFLKKNIALAYVPLRSCCHRFRSHCAVPIEPSARQSRSAALLSPPKKQANVPCYGGTHVEKPLFNSCLTINSTKTTCCTHRN